MRLTVEKSYTFVIMDSMLYFVIIAIQFSSLATHPIPLKCFLQNGNILNIFGTKQAVGSFDTIPLSTRFGTIKAKSVAFDKEGWKHDAFDLEYEGLDNSVLDDFGINFATNVAKIKFHTDDILLTYSYTTSGSLFEKPIYGEGNAKISLKNTEFDMNIPFDIKEVDGKKYIELKDFESRYDIKDKLVFEFSNLYNGNKELYDSMHLLINKNWKYVTTHFGKGFMDVVSRKVFNVFKNQLLAMPLKDLSTC